MFSTEADKLLFSAKLVTNDYEDQKRVFGIHFILAEQAVMIFEGKSEACLQQRKFLQKTVITNPVTRQPYTEKDFFVGAKIFAVGRQFELTEAPEYTLALMEANSDRFPMSDLQTAMEALGQAATKEDLTARFEEIDPKKTGTCKSAEAIPLIKGTGIVPQFAITISRRFDEKGTFDYQTLLHYL